MDVNTRIDKMEEELKLVKNEIKQVLLEIQEHVLNIQNPFSTVVVSRGGVEAPTAASVTSSVSPTPEPQTAVAEPTPPPPPPPPPPPQYAPQQPEAPPQQPGAFPPGGGMPMPQMPQQQAGFGVGAYGETQVPGMPPAPVQQNGGQTPPPADEPPVFSPPPGRKRSVLERTDKYEIQDDFIADIDVGDDALEDNTFDDEASFDADDEASSDAGDEASFDADDDAREDDKTGFDEQDGPDQETEQPDDMETDVAPISRPTDAEPVTAAESPEAQPQPQLDLATLASLVQWTEQVVQRTGPEFAEALFEISEITGRLSSDLKQTLMLLVRLLSTNVNGSGTTVSAGETVRLLAQLDGLMGNTTKEDARLLPFLLEGNLEVLSLIRQ